jgi:lysophospholipase L1-like esterase
MSQNTSGAGLRYFDAAAAAFAVLVGIGVLVHLRERQPSTPAIATSLALAVAAAALFLPLRTRALTRAPAILAIVTVLLFGATIIAYVPLPMLVSMLGLAAGTILLLVVLVASGKRIGEPFTRWEAFRLLTVVATVAIMCAFGELFLRWRPGPFRPELQQLLDTTPGNSGLAHPYIGHLQRPNRSVELAGKDFDASHHIDRMGFRNPIKWPNPVDIVAVGDSLTFGLGVEDEEAWPAIVARISGAAVVNLGLVGASPEQYLRVFETYGAQVRPKLVIAGLYAQNDFWDAGMFEQWLHVRVPDNYMVWRNFGRPARVTFDLRDPMASAEGVLRAYVYPLLRSSRLYNLSRAVLAGQQQQGAGAPPIAYTANDGRRIELDPGNFAMMTEGATPDRPEFTLVLNPLIKLHRMAAAQNAHLLVVLQPSKEEVYMPLLGKPVRDPSGALLAALDREGIEYLDLGPVFRERASAGEALFFELDTHPNREGYALIGESVGAYLRSHADRLMRRR